MKQIKKTTVSKTSVIGASALALMVMPVMAHAAGITELLETIRGWLNMLVPMLITLGVIAFFWGLVKYLFKGDGEGKKEGLNLMMMGILAVFVMASIAGLVAMLQDTTGAGSSRTINPPCIGEACTTDY